MTILETIKARWKERGIELDSVGVRAGVPLDLKVIDPASKAAKAGNAVEIAAIANTATVDLDDEVVVPAGLNPSLHQKYGAIYYNHMSYGDMLPVGTLRSATLIDGGAAWRIRFAMASNAFAQDVLMAVREGVIRGVSIGFVRDEWGDPNEDELDEYGPHSTITRRSRWLETSVVPMPCNPSAMIDGVSEMPAEAVRSLETLVRKGRIGSKSATLMGLPKRRRNVVII